MMGTMMGTMTLTEFLLARITEDEGWARNPECEQDPYRLLAECEAKRKIIERCEPIAADLYPSSMLALSVLLDLALPYAGHPDYREEWRP